MSAVPVSCCIILKDGHVVIAQKPSGAWEFPGGKLEHGETMFGCAIREVMEELGIIIQPVTLLEGHEITTGEGKKYHLVPVVSQYVSGEILLTEHISARWVPLDELLAVNWSDADRVLLATFFEYLG
jgi:8-oxo-dGTP diphosphatase